MNNVLNRLMRRKMRFSLVMEVICFLWSTCGSRFLFHLREKKKIIVNYVPRRPVLNKFNSSRQMKLLYLRPPSPAKTNLPFSLFLTTRTTKKRRDRGDQEGSNCLSFFFPERPKSCSRTEERQDKNVNNQY